MSNVAIAKQRLTAHRSSRVGGKRSHYHPALLFLPPSVRSAERLHSEVCAELSQQCGKTLEEQKKRELQDTLVRRLQKRLMLLSKVTRQSALAISVHIKRSRHSEKRVDNFQLIHRSFPVTSTQPTDGDWLDSAPVWRRRHITGSSTPWVALSDGHCDKFEIH